MPRSSITTLAAVVAPPSITTMPHVHCPWFETRGLRSEAAQPQSETANSSLRLRTSDQARAVRRWWWMVGRLWRRRDRGSTGLAMAAVELAVAQIWASRARSPGHPKAAASPDQAALPGAGG
ncbi:hypothetical protein NL676_001749 [Syzygium grande]|nr:hypothetical protein NL676_001749 [Syzygium grande]